MTIIAESPADQEEPALRLPSLPAEQPLGGFPVLMTVAPVVVSLVLFAILRTPYVLMFAILGPVLGTANVIDQRLGRKRRRKRAEVRFAEEAAAAKAEIARAHRRVLSRKRTDRPLARDLVRGARRIEPGFVAGTTTVRSGLKVEGAGSDDRSRELARLADRLEGVPIAVECTRVCVTGPRAEVTGAVRALVVQLLAERLDARLAIRGEQAMGVIRELESGGFGLAPEREAEAVICAHESGVGMDSGCSADSDAVTSGTATIAIAAGGAGVLTDSDRRKTSIRVDTLGASMLAEWLPRCVAAQRQRSRAALVLPTSCDLADLVAAPAAAIGGMLGANFLLAADGTRSIDLVADGPHALIGGTTGSGKSELLIAWAAALASSHSSDECNLLCIDFKGGATFDAVADLPHCVGVVTDLDDDEAARVGASLRAEVRRREHALRDLGARDIGDLEPGQLPRLIVFVDEFQALLETHPDLQEVFADVGARGRSLGIHLVLCTQRPAGAFRESLLANAAIRICLRVEQPSDSMTLLGNTEGARIGREPRGRALVRVGTDEPFEVQVAIARPALIAELSSRERTRRDSSGLGFVRKPWHAPLPEQLDLEPLIPCVAAGTIAFARGDLPDRQQQPVIGLERPGQHLFAVGMAESGKSGLISAIAAAAAVTGIRVRRVGGSVESAWDEVTRLLNGSGDGSGDGTGRDAWTIVLIDDVDTLEQQFDDEHRAEWLDNLQRLLRTGTRLGLSLVLTARRTSGSLQRLKSLCADTLYFAAPSRQEWILQGADPADWHEGMPPGRGRLGRLLVQVANDKTPIPIPQADAMHSQWWPFEVPAEGMVVTGRRLAPVREVIRSLGIDVGQVPSAAAARTGELQLELDGKVLLGDSDQWSTSYGTLPKFAEHVPVLAVGMTPGEWRSTFRGDPLYPALEDSFNRALLRYPDGTVERVRLADGRPVMIERKRRIMTVQ